MTRHEIRDGLKGVMQRLDEIIRGADRLENKNFRDIAMTARGRLQQLTEHPDLHRVAEQLGGGEQQPGDAQRKAEDIFGKPDEPPPYSFDSSAGSGGAPLPPAQTERQNTGGQPTPNQPFDTPPPVPPGTQPAPKDDSERTTFKPGEPVFQPDAPQRNTDFRDPAAVDLNRDGTLQRAPNAIGTQPDVREPGK